MRIGDKHIQTKRLVLTALVLVATFAAIVSLKSGNNAIFPGINPFSRTRVYSDLGVGLSAENNIMRTTPNNLHGFNLIISVESPMIEPDLSKQIEFKTSQLVVINEKAYPSRKVFYKSTSRPKAVLVVPLDANDSPEILSIVLAERRKYCEEHGYGLFARYTQDFAADGKQAHDALGFAPLRMLRQAMVAFPYSEWFWLLNTEMHIINTYNKLVGTDLSELNKAMETELNTESVAITNFAHEPAKADIIITSDPQTQMISSKSLAVRQSLPGQQMLELIADPLFQNWEAFFFSSDPGGAILTHVSRWHPKLVSSMALVSPRFAGTLPCSEDADKLSVCTKTKAEWLKEIPQRTHSILG